MAGFFVVAWRVRAAVMPRIPILACLFSLIGVGASASDPIYGLSSDLVEYVQASEWIAEHNIRDALPAFRFVRDPASVPAERVQTGPVEAIAVPLPPALAERMLGRSLPPLVATLHDIETGQPLQSCTAPCRLDWAPGRPAWLMLYRFGGEIMFLELPLQRDDLPTLLARMGDAYNAADTEIEREACRAKGEIKRAREVSAAAEPCFSVPPAMPPAARRSGRCTVGFDVAEDGALINVATKSCTEALFCDVAARTVSTWHYVPAVELRAFVPQAGLETRVQWWARDQHGTDLPEPDTLWVACQG